MANEITVLQQIRLLKGALKHEFIPLQFSLTQTGTAIYDRTHDIATSETTVGATFGNITDEGLMVLHNLDATNFVRFGFSTGVYGGKLFGTGSGKGLPHIGYIVPNTQLFMIADTGACEVRVIVYEL